MMASGVRGTLYIGVTSDLMRRVSEHRLGLRDGFTKDHGVKRLVWFEPFAEIAPAIAREKAMKFWKRAWKVQSIEEANPHWDDLAVGLGSIPCLQFIRRHTGERRYPLSSRGYLHTI